MRWRCLWTFLFFNVPTFATRRLQEILAAEGGTTWARNGRRVLPENARLPRNIQGSFTCRKSTTWDRLLYLPSEGRRTEDFFVLKNPTSSVGFEPANLGTKGQHATSRPPKPLNCSEIPSFYFLPLTWGRKNIFLYFNLHIFRLEMEGQFLKPELACTPKNFNLVSLLRLRDQFYTTGNINTEQSLIVVCYHTKLKCYLLATVLKFPQFSWQNILNYLIMRVSQM